MDMSRGSLAVWRKTLYRDASVAADQEEGKEEKEMDRGHSLLDRFGYQHSSETYRRQTQMVSCSAHRQPFGRPMTNE